MTLVLLHAGIPIGRLDLDDGEPAAGELEPLPAYESVAEPLRREGDLLRRRQAGQVMRREAGVDRRSMIVAEAAAVQRLRSEADVVRERLELRTEDGQQVLVAWIDVADTGDPEEAPFVLVYFRDAPAGVQAHLAQRPIGGASADSPAAQRALQPTSTFRQRLRRFGY